MTQEIFPEIKQAMEALEKRVTLTEAETAQMSEGIKAKKLQVKAWRKALGAFTPRQGTNKKKALAA